MTLTIAPPDLQPSTASSAKIVLTPDVADYGFDDIVEEPMDYSPIPPGRVIAPDFADEEDSPNDVGPGPMGY